MSADPSVGVVAVERIDDLELRLAAWLAEVAASAGAAPPNDEEEGPPPRQEAPT